MVGEMTPDQLQTAGRCLYGEKWRAPFEAEFGVSNRGLRRLLKGQSGVGDELAGRIMASLATRYLTTGLLLDDLKSAYINSAIISPPSIANGFGTIDRYGGTAGADTVRATPIQKPK